eukprot:SAG22_NODE_287_length_12963_cov_21.279086_9_plen_214_part_00
MCRSNDTPWTNREISPFRFDALDSAFIERRRHWLQVYLDQLCREPLAVAAEPTQIFLGLFRPPDGSPKNPPAASTASIGDVAEVQGRPGAAAEPTPRLPSRESPDVQYMHDDRHADEAAPAEAVIGSQLKALRTPQKGKDDYATFYGGVRSGDSGVGGDRPFVSPAQSSPGFSSSRQRLSSPAVGRRPTNGSPAALTRRLFDRNGGAINPEGL